MSVKPPCKTNFGLTELFFKHHIPSKYSETPVDHVFSQQCIAKQLKRYKVMIDYCLKCSEKNYDLPNSKMDLQGLTPPPPLECAKGLSI